MAFIIVDSKRLNVINGDGKAKVLIGLRGDDYITGSKISEVITGNAGNDYAFGGLGNDVMDGGGGIDTAAFSGSVDHYTFSWNTLGQLKIVGADGTDLISNFEKLKFGETTFNINGVIARSDAASTTENQNVTINVLSNDQSLKTGAKLFVQKANAATNAAVGDVVATNSDGVILKLAALNGSVTAELGTVFDYLGAGETTTTTLSYAVGNGTSAASTATLKLTITGQNDGPTAVADDLLGKEDEPITVSAATLLGNDTDPDRNDALSVTGVGGATHGVVALNNGQITFTPDADFYGLATFDYTISDGKGGTSTATVQVDVEKSAEPDLPDTFSTVDIARVSLADYDEGGFMKIVKTYDDPANASRNHSTTSYFEDSFSMGREQRGGLVVSNMYRRNDYHEFETDGVDRWGTFDAEYEGRSNFVERDQVISEFNVTSSTGTVSDAVLRLSIGATHTYLTGSGAITPPVVAEIFETAKFEFYAYGGNGEITLEDFDIGTLSATRILATERGETVEVHLDADVINDILAQVRAESGDDFIGIGIRATLPLPTHDSESSWWEYELARVTPSSVQLDLYYA